MICDVLTFGTDGLAFVDENLRALGGSNVTPDPPLARRLNSLHLSEPFAFFTSENEAPHDFNSGLPAAYPEDGAEDKRFALAVSRWLAQSPSGVRGAMVIEESVATYSDGWAVRHRAEYPDAMTHLGDTIYWTAQSGDGDLEILQRLRDVRAFSNVGVLSAPPTNVLSSRDLEIPDLEALVTHAEAVFVRAWDDGAYLIAPVAGSLIAEQLEPAPLDEPRGDHS